MRASEQPAAPPRTRRPGAIKPTGGSRALCTRDRHRQADSAPDHRPAGSNRTRQQRPPLEVAVRAASVVRFRLRFAVRCRVRARRPWTRQARCRTHIAAGPPLSSSQLPPALRVLHPNRCLWYSSWGAARGPAAPAGTSVQEEAQDIPDAAPWRERALNQVSLQTPLDKATETRYTST